MIEYLYSDRVWIDGKLQPATLGIREGLICHLEFSKQPEARDYSGSIIMPGAIDAHVHINEPGRRTWEGFDAATRAAAWGGTTTLIDMPLNSSPVTTTITALAAKKEATRGQLHVNCGFWAGGIGQPVADIEALLDEGCLGVKVFLSDSGLEEFPKISLPDLEKLMKALGGKGIPVLAHCELDSLPADKSIRHFPRSYSAYLASRPRTWEHEAIVSFLEAGLIHQCKAHVVHLASADILPWIERQKQEGPFTVETCPHYLFFHAEAIADGNTLLKCAPPIREKDCQLGLVEGIKTGVIDFLATDHSPALPELKALRTGEFPKAWGGISGLQFLLAASWTALRGEIGLGQFIPLLTERPARFLGLEHRIGSIGEGMQADLCIWQPEVAYTVTDDLVQHRHRITPYLGHRLYGTVLATYVNGTRVFADNQLLTANCGQLMLKEQHGE